MATIIVSGGGGLCSTLIGRTIFPVVALQASVRIGRVEIYLRDKDEIAGLDCLSPLFPDDLAVS